MDECLKRLFPPAIKHLRGTSAVWQRGSYVYKYPTDATVDVHLNELQTIASVPPQFAAQVGFVYAKIVPHDLGMLEGAPDSASQGEFQLIEMPLADGVEAFEIVCHPNFPQVAVAAAAVAHCRRMAELGYANTDIKLENIMVSDQGVTFVDWGGICRLDSPPLHVTYEVSDRSGLGALEVMKIHLTLLIGEMGGLYLGEPLPGGSGQSIAWSDVEMARRFCTKQLDSDTLALYLDFMGSTGA